MNSRKLLTVSIAAYNVAECISKCLDTFIKCKEFNNLDLIVVDDGSKDNTLKIVEKYAIKYPYSIRLIPKDNGGHGSTINTSIKHAKGKYYKVVDADDWIESDNLDLLVNFLIDTEASLIMNPYYEVAANNIEKKKLVVSHTLSEYEPGQKMVFDEVSENIVLAMHSMTIKTSLLKQMGAIIDEHCFYVDTEYTIFPVELFEDIVILDHPIYDYLLGTATQSMNLLNMQKRRDQHLKVTKRLVGYFNDATDRLSIQKVELVKKRITSVLIMQYVIYLTMPPMEIKKEIIDFDKWLKDISPNLYKNVLLQGKISGSGYMKAVNVARVLNYNGYAVYIGILQTFKIIKS